MKPFIRFASALFWLVMASYWALSFYALSMVAADSLYAGILLGALSLPWSMLTPRESQTKFVIGIVSCLGVTSNSFVAIFLFRAVTLWIAGRRATPPTKES